MDLVIPQIVYQNLLTVLKGNCYCLLKREIAECIGRSPRQCHCCIALEQLTDSAKPLDSINKEKETE